MARILITSAIPYINGVKHLGNLIGSMLPADAYARYARARGHEVMLICATDEHGTPAELAAAKAGQDVADYCAAPSKGARTHQGIGTSSTGCRSKTPKMAMIAPNVVYHSKKPQPSIWPASGKM